MNSVTKASQSEGFLSLLNGKTFYRIDGVGNARSIILIHGATVASWEFELIVPILVACGFQVLRIDLYGHGLSDKPKVGYELSLFVDQVQDAVLRLDFPVDDCWLGRSMGGAICAGVLGRQGLLPRQVILTAPMLNFSVTNRFARILRVPGLGELFVQSVGRYFLTMRRRRRYSRIGQQQFYENFLAQSRSPGFWSALRAMERDGALGDQSQVYRRLSDGMGDRVTILWGSEDKVIPREHIDEIREMLPGHRFYMLDELEHNLLLSHPELLSQKILSLVDPS